MKRKSKRVIKGRPGLVRKKNVAVAGYTRPETTVGIHTQHYWVKRSKRRK